MPVILQFIFALFLVAGINNQFHRAKNPPKYWDMPPQTEIRHKKTPKK